MTVVRGHWFPAAVVLPEQPRPWQRCYVVAADDGLHVFRRPSESADWHSSVNWSHVTLPRDQRTAERGFDVHTTRGLAVVTLGTGCRCGAMGRWAGPLWSRTETVRA